MIGIGALTRGLGWPLARRGRRLEGAEAIVVLGAPLRPDGTLGPVLVERVDAGVALWARGVAPVVCLMGGRTRGAVVAEAEAMAAAARARGVPPRALVVETESQTTYENARNAAEILMPMGVRRVVIVTQPFHLARARFHFERFGFATEGHFIAGSVQFRGWRGLRWVLLEYPSLARDWLLWLSFAFVIVRRGGT